MSFIRWNLSLSDRHFFKVAEPPHVERLTSAGQCCFFFVSILIIFVLWEDFMPLFIYLKEHIYFCSFSHLLCNAVDFGCEVSCTWYACDPLSLTSAVVMFLESQVTACLWSWRHFKHPRMSLTLPPTCFICQIFTLTTCLFTLFFCWLFKWSDTASFYRIWHFKAGSHTKRLLTLTTPATFSANFVINVSTGKLCLKRFYCHWPL